MLDLFIWICWQVGVSYASIVYQDLQTTTIADLCSNLFSVLYVAYICRGKIIVIMLQCWVLLRGNIYTKHPVPGLHASLFDRQPRVTASVRAVHFRTERNSLTHSLPIACLLATPEMTAKGFDEAMQQVRRLDRYALQNSKRRASTPGAMRPLTADALSMWSTQHRPKDC